MASFTPQGALRWVRAYGTDGAELMREVEVDTSFNFYLVGSTSGMWPGHTAAGSKDPYVVRTDPAGNVTWVRQFGSSSYGEARCLAASTSVGEVIVGGVTNGALAGQRAGGQDVWVQARDAVDGALR